MTGRITYCLKGDRFARQTGSKLNLDNNRVMICGSMQMLNDHKILCEKIGMREGSNSELGYFAIKKAFVD